MAQRARQPPYFEGSGAVAAGHHLAVGSPSATDSGDGCVMGAHDRLSTP
jgi:hypothetical protein